jgi:hypothetical protein
VLWASCAADKLLADATDAAEADISLMKLMNEALLLLAMLEKAGGGGSNLGTIGW